MSAGGRGTTLGTIIHSVSIRIHVYGASSLLLLVLITHITHTPLSLAVDSAHRTFHNHGTGRMQTGGKPSTAMGHCVGFGCTEEHLLYTTLGCKERGNPSQGPFRHTTGEGWVRAHEGHYNDAIHTKHMSVMMSVKVMIFDDLGGATVGNAGTTV